MRILFVTMLLLTFCACVFAQQEYVGRYDAYTGFSYLDSSDVNLEQRGMNVQLGYNARRWLALGIDYSVQFGKGTLVPNELKPVDAAGINELIYLGEHGYFSPITIPNNYNAYAPFDATTQTYAAGPNFICRHFKKATFFAHPTIGAIHENITVDHHDAFTQHVVLPALLGQLPNTTAIIRTVKPDDTTYFYGFGGGFELNTSKHVHIRTDVEFVHVNLFSSFLANSRNSVRFSVGPTFSFGKNVTR